MKKVVFVASNSTALAGMLFIIQKMREIYKFEPVLFCENCYYETDEFQVINLTPDFKAPETSTSINEEYGGEKKKVVYQIVNFFVSLRKMLQDNKRCKAYMKQNDIEGIIIYCDRMCGIGQGFIKNKGIRPVILVPIADSYVDFLFAPRKYNLELRISKSKLDINKIAKKINDKWVYMLDETEVLFYSLGRCLAGYFCKMISFNPWVVGGGGSTHVLVKSKEEAKEIAKISKKEVVVTGLLEDYYILESKSEEKKIQDNIREKYNINSEKVMIFSMPQLAEHGMVSWEVHKNNMKKLIKNMTVVYGKFLVSLHPKSCKQDYLFLKEFGEFEIVEERLRDIVSGCDILIAFEKSSVHRFMYVLDKQSVEIKRDWLLEELNKEREYIIREHMEIALKKNITQDAEEREIRCVPEEIVKILEQNRI